MISRFDVSTDPFVLADTYLTRHAAEHLRFHRGRWLIFDGVRYRELHEAELRARITLLAKEMVDAVGFSAPITRAVISNAVQAVAAQTIVATDIELPVWLGSGGPRRLISFKNGLFDLDAALRDPQTALEPHSPNWLSTIALPYEYDARAGCPRWEGFLHEVLGGDADLIALVQEWFGCCLTSDTSFQKFVILTGEGSNGKSVLLDILVRMLGEENVSHVPLELFGQRFQLIETVGRLANVATEIGEIDRLAEGILKAFTAGDRMQFEAKGKQPVPARPTAKLVFATNNLPRFADRSSGIWRRMLLVPFGVVIPPERQDPHLVEKLSSELPGILNWALEGLRRLQEQGRFTQPVAAEAAKAEYRLESNPARAFLQDAVAESSGGVLPCETLYDLYCRWCDRLGLEALASPQFGKEVRRMFPAVVRVREGGRGAQVGIYRGLAIR